MKSGLAWLALGWGIVCAQSTPAAAAQLRISPDSPTLLAGRRSPQLLYVRPGNSGALIMTDSQTSDPSHLQSWQDVYCNAQQFYLAASDYETTPASSTRNTRPQYWERLESWMTGMALDGQIPIWVADREFARAWKGEPALLDDVCSAAVQMAKSRLGAPALVLDLGSDIPTRDYVAEKLRTLGYPGLIGARFRKSAEWPAQARDGASAAGVREMRWDFVVADEAAIPEHYRGQAAAAWVRSRSGQVPTIIAPNHYDMRREVVWVGCGVAGFWYPPLPAADPAKAESDATNLRASTAFFNRFGLNPPGLTLRPVRGIDFSLETSGSTWAGFVPAGSDDFDIETPAGLAGRGAGRSWYNPATDQTIILPLTQVQSKLRVSPPDQNLWVYMLLASSHQADTATTVTAIRPWDD